MNTLSIIIFILSLISVVGSISIWYMKKGTSSEDKAHAERFGIFVGLWAPTFLGIAIFLRLLLS
ncbi:MAG: hypothetical protein FI704_07525 [SAR202 cluster bacterium]|jgi:hypothetical protein|nr:hypothetical protein [SAR202 cluster bacterium]